MIENYDNIELMIYLNSENSCREFPCFEDFFSRIIDFPIAVPFHLSVAHSTLAPAFVSFYAWFARP